MANLTKIATPVGKLSWVNISGVGKLNYNEDGREYVASIILDSKTAKTVIDSIADVYEQSKTKGKTLRSLGYKPCDEDGKTDDSDNPAFYSFNFKTKTSYQDGKAKKITVYNAKAKKVDIGDTKIGNGTIGAISGAIGYYVNGKSEGITLYLNSVQIINLVEYGEDAGFTASDNDDGFEGVSDTETGFQGQTEEDILSSEKAFDTAVANRTAKPRL